MTAVLRSAVHAGTGPPRILILTASMGGGHLQISTELRRRCISWGYAADIVDILDLMPGPTGRLLGCSYPLMVDRAPKAYEVIYDLLIRGRSRSGKRLPVPTGLIVPGLRRLVQRIRPSLVVSTYPLAALAVGWLKATGDLACPAATVITTFSVNNLWLHPAVDLELCISVDAAAEVQRRIGRSAQVCGPILRPGFRPSDKAKSRSRGQTRHVALVSTGSIGLAGSAVQAARIIAAHSGWRAVVLCGRNDQLRTRLSGQPGVVALGWVDDMPSVMAAADVLVDNAGGMSSKEALGAGMPIVTFRPIPGNGRYDTTALARLGLTDLTETPGELMAALGRLVDDQRHRASRVARGRALFVDRPLAALRQLVTQSAEYEVA